MENGVSGSWLSCKHGGGGGSVVGRNFQPFNIFSPCETSSMAIATAFKSTDGNELAANMGHPFTSAQRKELERQVMICNFMMASLPVPSDLLFPAPPNPSICLTDQQLERCKRTDGKKWRCSKDVVPNHKYCERHLQKSRPRSRKHVEVKTYVSGINKKKSPLLFNPKTEPSNSTCERDLGMVASQQWEHLVDASVGFGDGGSIYSSIASVFNRDYLQQCSSGLESDIGEFFNPDLVFPDKQPQNENGNFESSVSSEHGNLSSCSIEMRQDQVEFGVDDSSLSRPVSWMSFAQGGPLAEALRPGSVPGSPISTPATTVSSPSGVLHWTLFSHSDSSVCNSPTTLAAAAAAATKPEDFAFQHLS